MKIRILVLLALAVLLTVTMGAAAAAALAQNTQSTNSGGSTTAASDPITVPLKQVGGSGVSGTVQLQQLMGGGTHIDVTAMGLKPSKKSGKKSGPKYVSLIYDNHTCQFESYSQDEIIGGRYTANKKGVGHTAGNVADDLNMINSVSVRAGSTFGLLACADVHP